MSSYTAMWLVALLATLLLESGIVVLWRVAIRVNARPLAIAPLLLLVVGLNLLTHPAAWSARLWGVPWLPIECGVFLVEWCGLAQAPGLNWRIAGLLSLAMNGATAWIATVVPWWLLAGP